MHGRNRSVAALVGVFALVTGTSLDTPCITSFGLDGRCVAIDVCPRLKALLEKPILFQRDNNILMAAANACSKQISSVQVCCGLSEMVRPSVKVPPVHSEVESKCLQSRLDGGDEFLGASTGTSSFGVFITIGPSKQTRCVGSLITPEYILTVAHCAPPEPPSKYVVYVNADSVVKNAVAGLQVDVEPSHVREIIVHEHYNESTLVHDIALLRLSEKVSRWDNSVPHPVCIPMNPDLDGVASVGHMLQCFGWGYTAHLTLSASKQWLTLKRISIEDCQNRMATARSRLEGHQVTISKRNICTVTITDQDAFSGFSGGPLMYEEDGRWFLVGVISHGVGRFNNEFPVVSINVQQYTDWVLSKIRSEN